MVTVKKRFYDMQYCDQKLKLSGKYIAIKVTIGTGEKNTIPVIRRLKNLSFKSLLYLHGARKNKERMLTYYLIEEKSH